MTRLFTSVGVDKAHLKVQRLHVAFRIETGNEFARACVENLYGMTVQNGATGVSRHWVGRGLYGTDGGGAIKLKDALEETVRDFALRCKEKGVRTVNASLRVHPARTQQSAPRCESG